MSLFHGHSIAFQTGKNSVDYNFTRMMIAGNGHIGIGTTNPLGKLHIVHDGAQINGGTNDYSTVGGMIVEAKTGSRSLVSGAQIEFMIPANSDGSNSWGQARILTVGGNTNNGDATGKLVFGTRRQFDKISAGVHWYYGDDLVINGKGYIGIGTSNPQATLEVGGEVLVSGYTSNIDPISTKGNLNYLKNTGKMLIAWNRSGEDGETDFISNQGSGGNGGFGFYNYNNNGQQYQLFNINGNGTVGVGTKNTQGYKLAVAGSVIAESLKIKLQGTWPDYVFNHDHKLLTLKEVNYFINENNHLPGIPSAKEIKKDGLNVEEMNRLLMQKIEELTLYLIQQDKQLNTQGNIIEAQGKQLEIIKSQLSSKCAKQI